MSVWPLGEALTLAWILGRNTYIGARFGQSPDARRFVSGWHGGRQGDGGTQTRASDTAKPSRVADIVA